MTFGGEATANAQPLEDLGDFLERFDAIFAETGQEVVDDVGPDLLETLQTPPPPRIYPGEYPVEWTSERQRRAYFATDGFGSGIPYKRTGGLAAAWSVEGQRSGEAFALVVSNPIPGAKYVYGRLDTLDGRTARVTQQRFHRIIGWPLAAPIIRKAIERGKKRFDKKLQKRLAGLGSGAGRRRRR